nr:uncharacterized protein LOC115264504 [Aedes albopictus]
MEEIVVEELVADSDLINDADEQPDLKNIIMEEWKLESTVYAILISHGVTMEYLKVLDEKALGDIFSVVKWTGHKHALRSKLEQWKESALYRPLPSITSNPVSGTSPGHNAVPGPSHMTKLLQTTVTNHVLLGILERNEKGKIVCQYYQAHQRLDMEQRRSLAHTIVDYYIANNTYFTLADMERFADLIAARFPPEISETYYNPRDSASGKKYPSGLLYDRFHNRKKTGSRRQVGEIDPWTRYKAEAVKLTADETNRLTSIKNWLRNNLEPFDEILQRWSDSWLLRVTSIIKEAEINKSNILQEWPRLADPNGYLLIDADYGSIYESSRNATTLYDNWDTFLVKFRKYISRCNIKDHRSLQLLDYLEEGTLADGIFPPQEVHILIATNEFLVHPVAGGMGVR